MPSSLLIVALAAAWLIVLVPMIARKRQEIARTNDSALAARVVRSGGVRHERWEEFTMSENTTSGEDLPAGAGDEMFDEPDEVDVDQRDTATRGTEEWDSVDRETGDWETGGWETGGWETGEWDERDRAYTAEPRDTEQPRTYRPGRGGFDPEAAEIAARAKYAYRQRVVLALLVTVVLTAVVAGTLWSMLWWLNGVVDVALVGYLAYLRRQVRIENDIRQRRLDRLNRSARQAPPAAPDHADRGYRTGRPDRADRSDTADTADADAQDTGGRDADVPVDPRLTQDAVVLDLEDEDPAFHELDQPGEPPYRKAAGE